MLVPRNGHRDRLLTVRFPCQMHPSHALVDTNPREARTDAHLNCTKELEQPFAAHDSPKSGNAGVATVAAPLLCGMDGAGELF